jgi:hypothetical protein
MALIRILQSITGSFHNIDGGVERGEIVDVEEVHALRYVKSGLAERVGKEPAEEESAVVEPEKVESAVVKRTTRGRPKKQPDWHEEHAPGWKDASPED